MLRAVLLTALVTLQAPQSLPVVGVTFDARQTLHVLIASPSGRPVCLPLRTLYSYRRVTVITATGSIALTDGIPDSRQFGCLVVWPGTPLSLDFPLEGRLPVQPIPSQRVCYDVVWHFGSTPKGRDKTLRSCVHVAA
jgi:hypothetical protein